MGGKLWSKLPGAGLCRTGRRNKLKKTVLDNLGQFTFLDIHQAPLSLRKIDIYLFLQHYPTQPVTDIGLFYTSI